MSMSNDISLILPENFGGRVTIRPNAADSVYVDASSNSANGRDDDDRVHFITYRGKDYTSSGSWTRGEDGTWTTNYPKVSQRASFGLARAPKTYEAAINKMIAERLEAWYAEGGQRAMNRAALKNAENEVHQAEGTVADAQAALNDALAALRTAESNLTLAQLATVTLHAPSAS